MRSRNYPSVVLPAWVVVLLLVNVIILDAIMVFQLVHQGRVLGVSTTDSCPSACITKINQMAGKTVSATAKEYYVPLGSGTNTTDEWADVAGASATIDTASYGKIKQVTFEATVTVPAGSQKVWVRLFNVTDKHPVWYAEMTTDSAGPILLTSPTITLDKGNKTYQVQMKTQLKNLTNLVQSRVKIVTY
jgi:hypothetical protein